MRRPGFAITEVPLGMVSQACDDRSRQGALAHVGKRLIVDHIVGVAGTQAFEEVQAALRVGGGEPSEVVVADLGADGVLPLVASASVVNADPARRRQAGAQDVACLVKENLLA